MLVGTCASGTIVVKDPSPASAIGRRSSSARLRPTAAQSHKVSRIQLWTFSLPALCDRREDLSPNLDYELRRFAETEGRQITFNKEARDAFLRFAIAPNTPWHGNFRDFNAAIVRMGSLAQRGRIRRENVEEEISSLRESWQRPQTTAAETVDLSAVLDPAQLEQPDSFDRVQLAHVVAVCQRCKSNSEAGRELFAVSRNRRAVTNDSDRLKKYLAKWDLTFQGITR